MNQTIARRAITAVCAAAAVSALVGCGSASTSQVTPVATHPVASASPSVDPQVVSQRFNKLAYTKPGTKLKLGAPAVVRYDDGAKGLGALRISLVSITKGTPNDEVLKHLQGALGYTPYYLKWHITGDVAADRVHRNPTDQAVGWLSTNTASGWVQSWGFYDPQKLPECPVTPIPDGFAEGSSYDTCSVALAKTGEVVTGAAWLATTPTPFGASGTFGHNPIVWKP